VYETKFSPGEPLRGDLQAALVAHTVTDAHRTKGTRSKIKDYLLRFKRRTAAQDQGALHGALNIWKAVIDKQFGGKDNGD